jgi:AsmA-like C-terminal region
MLSRRPGRLRRAVLAAAGAAALLVLAVSLLPLFLDGDRVRHAIERRISAATGGEVRYDSLKLGFFPRPHVEARNATVRIPGAVDGRIGTLSIRIAALPLLAGEVRPVAVDVAQPVLEVTIPPGGGGSGGDPLAAYRAALRPVVDALVGNARGMSLGITDGKLEVRYAGQRVLSMSGLAVDALVATDAITANASGKGDLFGEAKASLRIAPESLAATGALQASGLRLPALLERAGAQGEVKVADGVVDATLNAETDGRESVRATVTAAAPQITLARGVRTLALGVVRATLDVSRDGAGFGASLRSLQVGELVPAATATLRTKPGGAAPAVEVQVPGLDLARLRAALIALAGDLDAVQAALAFVPTGTAQGLTGSASGADFGALAALGAIRAETQLAGGALELPAQGIKITGAGGRFALADGKLRGTELAGAIGKSTFNGGTLVVELAPNAALRELDAGLDADLAEALPIVRRLIGKPEPAALADVESLAGRASGSVAYDARHRPPRVTADLARIRANGRYRGVPLPIAVNAGALRYAHDRVVVRGLDGTVGHSQLRGGTMELALGAAPTVRAASADAVLVFEDLAPWLQSIAALRIWAMARTSVTGSAAVRLARLSGPLNAPAELDYDVTVRPRDMRLAGPDLPGPLTIASGDARLAPHTFALERLEVLLFDARAVLSGTVREHASPYPRFDLALADARAGERSLEWVRTRWQVPARAMPRAPVTLAAGRVQRAASGADAPILAQGTLSLAGGVSAELDLTAGTGFLDLRRLAVKDPDTDATLALKWERSAADLSFKGKFDNRTLARVLADPPVGEGALQGDFRATIDRAELRRSSATGALVAERIDVLERWDIPVAIERVQLDVAGDVLRIHDGAIAVAGERLGVTGTVTRLPATFGLDLRVAADAIDAGRLRRAFPAGEAKPAGGAWNLPVEGRVAVDAKSVAYGTRVFRPVAAVATLAPESIVAEVKELRLCGVALPFNATLVPGRADVTGRLEVRGGPLAGTISCLTGEEIDLTGTVDADAALKASGPVDALARTATGSFRFTARDGRIQRAPAITRILSLDTVSSLLRARPAELMERGLEYTEIDLAGTLDAGRVSIDRGTLDSPALGMAMRGEIDVFAERVDMRGIVAPFGDVHDVVRRIPVVGRVLGTRVVGVPLSVTGDLHDPRVVPLAPAAIGDTVVNLLGAVVRTPIDLLDPFVGRPQRAPDAPAAGPQ